MKITVYDRKSTNYLLFLLLVLYGFSAGLCAFFFSCYLKSEYNAEWIVLAAMFMAPFILVLICERKEKVISRYLLRCKISEHGIYCYGLLSKPWLIAWRDVCTYGISGYSRDILHVPLMFFSTDSDELFNKKKDTNINKKRIVISIRYETWPALGHYMPSDMKRNLQWSVENRRDCFHKRKPQNTPTS